MKLFWILSITILLLTLAANLTALLPNNNWGKTLNDINTEKQNKKTAQDLKSQLLFWENQINHQSDYRDAYLELSLLSWRLGRKFDANKFYQKGHELDPNFKTAGELKKILQIP